MVSKDQRSNLDHMIDDWRQAHSSLYYLCCETQIQMYRTINGVSLSSCTVGVIWGDGKGDGEWGGIFYVIQSVLGWSRLSESEGKKVRHFDGWEEWRRTIDKRRILILRRWRRRLKGRLHHWWPIDNLPYPFEREETTVYLGIVSTTTERKGEDESCTTQMRILRGTSTVVSRNCRVVRETWERIR